MSFFLGCARDSRHLKDVRGGGEKGVGEKKKKRMGLGVAFMFGGIEYPLTTREIDDPLPFR